MDLQEKKIKQEPTAQATQKSNKEPVESTYLVDEIVEMASVFGTVPEVAKIALKEKELKKATKSEAMQVIRAFLERKVN